MAVRARVLALGAAAAMLAGCYTYVPVQQPRTGTEVRVDVPVSSSVGNRVDAPRMMSFQGTLVGLGDTLVLRTRSRQPMGTHGEFTVYDTIRVNSSAYANLEERVLSKPRTVVFAAGLVGAGVLLAMAADGFAGGDEGEPPDDTINPEGSVRPGRGWRLFDVRIPLGFPPG